MSTCSNMLLSISHKSQLLSNKKMTIKHSSLCQDCLHFHPKLFPCFHPFWSLLTWEVLLELRAVRGFLQQAGKIGFGWDITGGHRNACSNWPVLLFSGLLRPAAAHPVAGIDQLSCNPNTVKAEKDKKKKNIFTVKHMNKFCYHEIFASEQQNLLFSGKADICSLLIDYDLLMPLNEFNHQIL